MRKLLLLFGCVCLLSINAFSATFTSVGVGNWNAGATWGNAGNTPGVDFPTAGDIANITTAVTIPGGFDATALDVTISDNASSSLVVTGTLTFTGVVTTGTASSGVLTVNGTITVEQGATMVAPSTNSFILNGTYRHNYTTTAGAIYRPTWNLGSTMEFIGYTSNTGTPTGLNQNFRNIVWNCANQGGNIYFTNAGGTVFNTTVNGNLTIQNTNGNRFGFNHATAKTLTISGNLSVVSTSKFNMNIGAGNTTINLKADLSIGSADGILTQSAGISTLRFNGAGGAVIQHITNSSSLSTSIAFEILNPAVVEIAAGNFISTPFDFTLFAGATLRVGTTDGIMQGSSGGAVRADGNKIYEDDANVVYMGSTNQDLGDEWSGALLGFAVNLEIATTSGASVTNNNSNLTSVVGLLTLTSGSLNIGNNNTLTISGDFAGAGGSFIGAGTPTAGTSGLTFSGSGSFTGTLNFAGNQILKTLTISRSGTFVLGTPLTVAAATGALLRFTSNGSLQFSGQTLTVNGNINQTSTGGLSSPTPTSTNLIIGGSSTLTSMGICSGCGTMELNNLTLNRSSATYSLAAAIRINGTLDLSQGTLNHSSGLTMVTGSTLIKSSGTTFSGSAPTASASYNLSYVGNQTTSLELPSSSTALNDLSIAGDVLMDKSITINGNVSITSGTLDASTFNITMAGATFAVSGGAFTMNSASTFTFSRSGITSITGSSLQFPNLTINSGTTFSAPTSFSVSGTWDNNGTFTPNSSTVTFNGAAQGIDPSGQPFNNVVFGGTSTKTLGSALDVNGTLTINSGVTLDVGGNNQINVAGTWSNAGTFNANAGLVVFDGAAQTITTAGQSFFNLQLSGSGTKTLGSSMDINGSLTIDPSITFDVTVTPYNINIAGNWINNGTFTRRTGTVTFDGTSTISGSGSASFANVTITGALTASSGTTDISGNWLQSSGTFTANGGTLQFSGATQNVTPGGQTFNNFTVAGSVSTTLQGATIIAGTLTTTSGTFNSNSQTLSLAGNFVSNSTSSLTGNIVTFNGTTIISGGTAPTFGAITITGSLTPNAAFNVNGNLVNNGTLNAGSGTVTFGGTTAISGSSTSSFNNVVVSSTLTAPAAMNVAGSWTNNGTFNHNSGTITFNGTTTINGSSTSSFSGVTISGSLTAPATTMNVAGNFTNSGTFANGGGTINFNGTTQTISGSATTFNNMNANSSTLNVNNTSRLDGILTLGSSTTFDADGSGSGVFIVSSSSVTAGGRIAAITGTATVSGPVTIERFIHGASGGDYRYISMPVTGGLATLLPWKNAFGVTGNFSDRSTNADFSNISDSGNTNPSVFLWNSTTQAYVAVDGSGGSVSSTAIDSRTGYAAYDFSDVAVIPSYRGPIEIGPIPLAISSVNNNMNLVPNPYPSPIDWDNVTKTNVNNALWLRTANNTFASYVSGVALGGPGGWTGEISTGQSFWTQSNGGGSTLTLNETDKTNGTSTFLRVQSATDYLKIKLKSSSQEDELAIRFINGGTDNLDGQYDAIKRKNGNYVSALGQYNYLNISSYISAPVSDFAVNTIGVLGKTDMSKVISLKVADVSPGSHTLTFTDFGAFALYKIYLEDHFLNKESLVGDNFVYTFSVTSNAQSFGNSRFSLRFEHVDIITAIGDQLELMTTAYPNPVIDKLYVKLSATDEAALTAITLVDVMGRPIVSSDRNPALLEPGVKTIDMSDQSSGFYLLNVHTGNMVKTIKVIKK